ncbi:MAG: class I SAM-dependent DNA methyltransferase [Pseudooceanicola sp.]
MPDYDLDNAYEIDGPDAARRHYDAWAATYDDSFARGWGYIAPREIAGIFRAGWTGGEAPVLDIGAGTGEVARHMDALTVDGIDISPEMLAVAGAKGLYRRRIVGDLTRPLDLPDDAYAGVISCGTFTHGHVGPGALPELLRVTRPGARFVCGTIAAVLDGQGFGSALARLVARGRISPVRFHEIAIYEGADHPHAGDRGLVMDFTRL